MRVSAINTTYSQKKLSKPHTTQPTVVKEPQENNVSFKKAKVCSTIWGLTGGLIGFTFGGPALAAIAAAAGAKLGNEVDNHLGEAPDWYDDPSSSDSSNDWYKGRD